jgi:hypothetical protein
MRCLLGGLARNLVTKTHNRSSPSFQHLTAKICFACTPPSQNGQESPTIYPPDALCAPHASALHAVPLAYGEAFGFVPQYAADIHASPVVPGAAAVAIGFVA